MGVVKLFLLAALVLALAACGSDSGSSEGSSSALEVTETDFALTPSTLTVDAEGEVTIKAVNNGQTEHALELEGSGVEEKTDTVGPGESAELTAELKPGTYELYCPIGNHRQLGMEGTITVGGAAGAGSTGATTGATETDDDSGYGQG